MINQAQFLEAVGYTTDDNSKLLKLFNDFCEISNNHTAEESLEFRYTIDETGDEIDVEIWFYKAIEFYGIEQTLIHFCADDESYIIFHNTETHHEELTIEPMEVGCCVIDYIKDFWLEDLSEDELPHLLYDIFVDNAQYDEFDYGLRD